MDYGESSLVESKKLRIPSENEEIIVSSDEEQQAISKNKKKLRLLEK